MHIGPVNVCLTNTQIHNLVPGICVEFSLSCAHLEL